MASGMTSLTPFTLPNPKEDEPYTIDQTAMSMMSSPFTAERGEVLLDQAQAKHALQRQQYQDYLNQAQMYGRDVLGTQKFEIGMRGIHDLLQDPNGFNVLMGIPEARRILSDMTPETATALGHSSFMTQQAQSLDKLADVYKKFSEAGGIIDPNQMKAMTGLILQLVDPTSIQVEKLKAQNAIDVENIKAGRPPPVSVPLTPQPGLGNVSPTAPMMPGETVEHFNQRMTGQGFTAPSPTVYPPRSPTAPTAPTAPKPSGGGAASAKPLEGPLTSGAGTTTIPPAFKATATVAPDLAELYAANDPATVELTKVFRSLAAHPEQDPTVPPEMAADINRLIEKNGTGQFNKRVPVAYGINKDGGYVWWPLRGSR